MLQDLGAVATQGDAVTVGMVGTFVYADCPVRRTAEQ
jgi:hypothetical protein